MAKKICTKAVREKAIELMKAEIETFSNWANGQCYGFSIEFADWHEVNASCNTEEQFFEAVKITDFEQKVTYFSNTDNIDWENVTFDYFDSCWSYIEDIANYEDMYVFKEALSQIE